MISASFYTTTRSIFLSSAMGAWLSSKLWSCFGPSSQGLDQVCYFRSEMLQMIPMHHKMACFHSAQESASGVICLRVIFLNGFHPTIFPILYVTGISSSFTSETQMMVETFSVPSLNLIILRAGQRVLMGKFSQFLWQTLMSTDIAGMKDEVLHAWRLSIGILSNHLNCVTGLLQWRFRKWADSRVDLVN